MHSLIQYREAIESYLKEEVNRKEPRGLYDPMHYILALGGKRLRPSLMLMSAEAYGSSIAEAMPAAVALEVFHNFSLVHDDIMDNAPLRRGKVTVHEKWDLPTGILSGDAMLIFAYQCFERYPETAFKSLVTLFSRTAQEVCEGQQYDMEFEERDDVSLEEYLHMITYKTAVLVGAATGMGAMVGGASEAQGRTAYAYGKLLGIAFQLQDDYLDAFGDPESFGKQVGGDIIENKKTCLYLEAIRLGSEAQRAELQQLFSIQPGNPEAKVDSVKAIYEESGAARSVRAMISDYTERAFGQLALMEIRPEGREALRKFGEQLMDRTH